MGRYWLAMVSWLLVAVQVANFAWTLTKNGPHGAMPIAAAGLVFCLAMACWTTYNVSKS